MVRKWVSHFRFNSTFIHHFVHLYVEVCGGKEWWGFGASLHLYAMACLLGERTTCNDPLSSPTTPVSGIELTQSSCQSALVPTEPSQQTVFYRSLFKLLKCKCHSHIKAGCNPHSCKLQFQPLVPSIFHPLPTVPCQWILAPSSTNPFHSHRHAASCILTFLCVHVLYPH